MTDYIKTGNPAQGSRGISKFVRDEFELIETAVNSKANIASPALTGTPTAPTAATGTSTTQLATTEFVANTSFTTNLPAQLGNANKVLRTDGTNASWSSDYVRLSANSTLTSAINTARATVASHATTANIWSATGNEINFTGTATVTDFPDAPQAGVSRILHIASTPTFTHNANITVSGGATYACRAGDIVLVHSVTTTTFRVTIFPYDYNPQITTGIINAATIGKRGVSSMEYLDEYLYATGLTSGSIFVCYGAGLFIASTSAGSDKVASSPDGETWTLRTMPSAVIWRVGYGASDGFLASVSSSTAIAKSTNGTTWSSATATPGVISSSAFNAPAANGTRWLVNSNTASTAYLSTNFGTSWSTETLPAANGSAAFYVVNGLFFYWSSGTTAYTSSTGTTGSWTSRTLPSSGSANAFNKNSDGSLSYKDSTGTVYRTTDGINWSSVATNMTTGSNRPALFFSSGVVLSFSSAVGECMSSHNGVRVIRSMSVSVTDGPKHAENGSGIAVIGNSDGGAIKMTSSLPSGVFG